MGRGGTCAIARGRIALRGGGPPEPRPSQRHGVCPRAVRVLALRASDLLEAIGEDRHAGDRMLELCGCATDRARSPACEAHHRTTPTGEIMQPTLKDTQRRGLLPPLPPGFFSGSAWMVVTPSGTSALSTGEFGAFAHRRSPTLQGGLRRPVSRRERGQRRGTEKGRLPPPGGSGRRTAARRIMEWQGSVRGVDEPLTRSTGAGMFLLYTRAAQVFLAAIALVGIVAFVLGSGARHRLEGTEGRRLAVVVLDPGDPGRASSFMRPGTPSPPNTSAGKSRA